MKKILLPLILFTFLGTTSCLKNWKCECIDENGYVHETELPLPKREAKRECESYGDDCILK